MAKSFQNIRNLVIPQSEQQLQQFTIQKAYDVYILQDTQETFLFENVSLLELSLNPQKCN
jgi:hypothetical protein